MWCLVKILLRAVHGHNPEYAFYPCRTVPVTFYHARHIGVCERALRRRQLSSVRPGTNAAAILRAPSTEVSCRQLRFEQGTCGRRARFR
jgi:hypothetical protein